MVPAAQSRSRPTLSRRRSPQRRRRVKLHLPGAPAIQIQLGEDAAGTESPTRSDRVADADIAAAKARCNVLLKDEEAVAVPEAPFRSGSCGTPAPMRLISVGKNPEVALSPPPVMTCE